MKKLLLPFALSALTVTAAYAEPATYKVETTHTFVTFEAMHHGTSTNRGRFDKKEGSITLDKAAKTGSAEITIYTDSINTGTSGFDKHLRGEDFFSAEKFPTAVFKSDSFTFDGEKVSAVKGELTMLGKTHPVEITSEHFNCYDSARLKREVCGGDFVTTIKRSQWGMDYGVAHGLPDDIKLVIQIEAVKM